MLYQHGEEKIVSPVTIYVNTAAAVGPPCVGPRMQRVVSVMQLICQLDHNKCSQLRFFAVAAYQYLTTGLFINISKFHCVAHTFIFIVLLIHLYIHIVCCQSQALSLYSLCYLYQVRVHLT